MFEEITPIGGLGNRLRVIFSYLNETRNGLKVNWKPDEEICFTKFENLFQPIPGVSFDEQAKGPITCEPKSWKREWQLRLKKELTPTLELQERINELKTRLGSSYAAIHVRRTDHTSLAKQFNQFTTDEDFINWVQKLPPDVPLYIACDNAESWQKLSSLITNRKVIHGVNNYSAIGKRFTSAFEAVVDLFICGDALFFKGSGFSSFSDVIHFLRLDKK